MAKHNSSAGGAGASGGSNASTASGASSASAAPNVYQLHQLAQIEKELNALRQCSHPNIVQFYDVLETDRSVFLIMEHLNSGELYDYILNKGRLDEKEAQRLFRQVVEAIAHIHQKGIVHRDLKPENILLRGNGDIVLVDFGLANYFDVNQPINVKSLRTQCGSPHYAGTKRDSEHGLELQRESKTFLRLRSKRAHASCASHSFSLTQLVAGLSPPLRAAPEILTGQRYSGPLADTWSLGVLLYAMVCGSLPFNARSIPMLIKKIVEGKFKLPKFLSPQVQHLIQTILQINPENRPAISEILEHPWCKKGADTDAAATGSAGEGYRRPLSRPEIISPQSYTNARSQHLLAAQSARLSHGVRGYHTVNANDASQIISDGSDEDNFDTHDELNGRVDDDEAAAASEMADGAGAGFTPSRGRNIIGGEHSKSKSHSKSGSGGKRGTSPGKDTSLPPSSALSFQPDSSLHSAILEKDEFATSSAAKPVGIPGAAGSTASASAVPWTSAATAAANAKKPISCGRCGKQLSVRTGESGAIVLAGTSLSATHPWVISAVAAQKAPDQDLCQCAASDANAGAPGEGFDPARSTPIQPRVTNSPTGATVAAAAADGTAAASSSSTSTLVGSNAPVPVADANAQYLAASPLAAGSSSGAGGIGSGVARRKATLPSGAKLLTAEELAAREASYKANVTSLFQAAERGDADTLAKLISPDSGAASPIAAATAPNGSPAALIPSLTSLDVRVTTIDSWTALHFGARNGHASVVQLLLTCWQPLDINSRTKSGWTPLMLAADKGHLDVVTLLLRYGAAIHVTNNDGKSAIFLARESGHPAIAQALTNASSSRHRKHTEGASARNNTSVSESGEETKQLNHQLHQAAECGDIAKVKHLLQLGRNSTADAAATAKEPRSPSGSAAPAAPTQSRRNSSRLDPSAESSSSPGPVARYCVDILSRGIDNWSVLHFAARKGRTAVVALLLDHDPPAELNALTKNGWSPLMLAADRGHTDTCNLLISAGADVNLTSNVRQNAAAKPENEPARVRISHRSCCPFGFAMCVCVCVCVFRVTTALCPLPASAVTQPS